MTGPAKQSTAKAKIGKEASLSQDDLAMQGVRLELLTGGIYQVSEHTDFNGVMFYINGTEVGYDSFCAMAQVWDKFLPVGETE